MNDDLGDDDYAINDIWWFIMYPEFITYYDYHILKI